MWRMTHVVPGNRSSARRCNSARRNGRRLCAQCVPACSDPGHDTGRLADAAKSSFARSLSTAYDRQEWLFSSPGTPPGALFLRSVTTAYSGHKKSGGSVLVSIANLTGRGSLSLTAQPRVAKSRLRHVRGGFYPSAISVQARAVPLSSDEYPLPYSTDHHADAPLLRYSPDASF